MGRKRRCVWTQLDATAIKNHVRMRGTQGTQEMASVTSGRGASASDVEYIFADAGCEVRGCSLGSYLYVSPTQTRLRIIKTGARTLELPLLVRSGKAEGSFLRCFLPQTQRRKFWTS